VRCRGLGVERKTGNLHGMTRVRITSWLICCCLLLALSGCGNKGPLVLPEEDEKKSKSETSY
jgi:predicted small lipoprotein YifL